MFTTQSGQQYTLEYDRKSAQAVGRDIHSAQGDVIAISEAIFLNAFTVNHNNVSKPKRREIFSELNDKESLIELLTNFYTIVVNETFDNKEAKTSWEVSEKARNFP